MRAVILAGGKGTRLAPYTAVLPKPLMPVGDMPILELLLRRLVRAGVAHVTLAVGHMAPLLMAYFQDGARFGVEIEYSQEGEPLGTAAPLKLVKGLAEPFLVMNGDLLTDVDFKAMVAAHHENNAAATVGVFAKEVKIDLGVIETGDTGNVVAYVEKPTIPYLVSMGVYVLEPRVLELIPSGVRFDLPELIIGLLDAREIVYGYRHSGYWLDIGRPEDYQKAQDDVGLITADLR